MARFLCAPTVKMKPDGTVFPVLPPTDGRDHLACYDIPPHPHQDVVNARTQFGDVDPDTTSVNHDAFLCVPSIKTVVQTPQVPSLAPWGIATLGLLMLLTVLGLARRRVR
jgi:hypothetical protein